MKKYRRQENELDNSITEEMVDYFYERTNMHITFVQQFGQEVNRLKSIDIGDRFHFIYNISHHDASKFKEPEYTPYIYLTWKKRFENEGKKVTISDKLQNDINKATEWHITHNEHHPEYWQDRKDNLINKKDRDDIPSQIIDATEMPFGAVVEMVCDWMAMSRELNDDPYKWAVKVINKRWRFNQKRIDLIYKILDNV